MMEKFVIVDFWAIVGPMVAILLSWFLNEWAKRDFAQRQKKEENYRKLLLHLRCFYRNINNAGKTGCDINKEKEKFIVEMSICWLYSSDDVIKKGNMFLDAVEDNSNVSNEGKKKAMGNFVAAIRKDNLHWSLSKWKKTELTGNDFKHVV